MLRGDAMSIDVTVSTGVSRSGRARQLEAMFDVPPADTQQQHWQIDAPYDDKDWQIGLIVGPSGSGKTTILRDTFGDEPAYTWDGDAVIDDFPTDASMTDISAVCQAVGFNTIPAWLRPYRLLSTGEQFRVRIARAMLDTSDTIVLDEFTSVVDRQVARIGSHAVQKWIRKQNRRLVVASCHYDIEDWLQPDWVIEPATQTFRWRSVQPRPAIDVTIAPVEHEKAWPLFAPYHYLTATLHRNAHCYCLFVDDTPAAFAGVLFRPHPKTHNVQGLSRLVTLPDWQGLGLAFVLCDTIAAAYRAHGYRFRTYPAHPALIRGYDHSPHYVMRERPGFNKSLRTKSSTIPSQWRLGSRPCAVFEYIGPSDQHAADTLGVPYARKRPARKRLTT